ncbi:hypothetical protein BHE74_00027631 [Ensete ventricosum]|nr:hypothetical protein GW17_00017238 [Ensete ventricosum]RWW65084.1 hypothetical protein BHE74_00027631 [Ensete ventricosum]RZS25532.1 hypothetical protein BHM03_00058744 [Ensete ventricosum]
MGRSAFGALFAVVLLLPLLLLAHARPNTIRLPSDRAAGLHLGADDDAVGTRWAVLIAGSNGYFNYRHQVAVPSFFFLALVVYLFLFGESITFALAWIWGYNSLQDYVGDNVNVNNFFAVLLGNKTALTGGSGKVVDSGPNDHIFIFYSDHGGPGVLG